MIYFVKHYNMKKKVLLITITLVAILIGEESLFCEQAQKDMFASVVVLPSFKLSLDNANINFGYTEPGKTVELYPQLHYNEVKCISNKGRTWYLKLSVIGDIVGPPEAKVGIDSFKWMVARAIGDGIVEKGWHPFSKDLSIAYTSGQ